MIPVELMPQKDIYMRACLRSSGHRKGSTWLCQHARLQAPKDRPVSRDVIDVKVMKFVYSRRIPGEKRAVEGSTDESTRLIAQ